MTNPRLRLALTQRAQQQGLATQKDLTEATLRATKAEALYRDAPKDTEAAVQRKVDALQRAQRITELQVDVQRRHLNTDKLLADRVGDTTRAEQIAQHREVDIKVSEA